MSRTLAYIPLLYGRPWLKETIHQILPQVDELHIYITDQPSCGHGTDLPCPDTKDELFAIIDSFPQDKILVGEGRWGSEADHCNQAWQAKDSFDWIVRADADEIYPDGYIAEMIRQAEEKPSFGHYRVPFVHLWRSLNWVCKDRQMPFRLHRTRPPNNESCFLDDQDGRWFVAHMGYAQPSKYIEYKLQVSLHKPEFRPEWLEEIWRKNAKVDIHPVSYGLWNAEPFDKMLLPEIVRQSPYWDMDLIP